MSQFVLESPISKLSPWHDGEVALQRTIGAADRLAEVGDRVMRDHLIEQHREFYPRLPFVVLGSVDETGDAWATLRAGHPGFLHAPDTLTLQVEASRIEDDPAEAGMEHGNSVGLLGIELHTRRRNRLNGTIRRQDGASFGIAVEQSFGNCPKYINLRQFQFGRDPEVSSDEPAMISAGLDAKARSLIANADAFFVASYVDREDGHRQIDVSHRGGKPGFVRIDNDGTLTIPDFAGNQFFNTLGNILVNPKAGLVFADFNTGDLLQLSGDATVLLNAPEIVAFSGAERMWRFRPRRAVYRADALPLRWTAAQDGISPNSLKTGSWD